MRRIETLLHPPRQRGERRRLRMKHIYARPDFVVGADEGRMAAARVDRRAEGAGMGVTPDEIAVAASFHKAHMREAIELGPYEFCVLKLR